MKGRTPPAGRTGRGRPSRVARWVLAALTLLAAAAFQARAGSGLPLPVPAAAGAHDHAAPPAGHPRPGPAADHAAHCLFCLTGAFALEPGAPTLSAAPSWPAPAVPTSAPRADFPSLRHADARAPPRRA